MSPITVNPTLLSSSSFPSPSSSCASSPAPSIEGPPRKRPRSDLSSEERKEARAHRNRIAAQNSRDRRKAHYSHLEQRIAELEEENRRLRAGQGEPPAPARRSADEERERDRARERENEELRERIKTLEKGWNAVVKALAAQGLPTGIPVPAQATTTTESSSSVPQSSNTNFPVIVPNSTTVSPISPAPSHTSSFDFESATVKSEPTCHLARVAPSRESPSVSLQRVDSRQNNSNSSLNSRHPLTLITTQRPSPTQRWKTSSAKFSRLHQQYQRRPSQWILLRRPPLNSKSRRRPPHLPLRRR